MGACDDGDAVNYASLCEPNCRWRHGCADAPDSPSCQQICASDSPKVWRANVMDAYRRCYDSLPCGASDDTCAMAVVEVLGETEALRLVSQCEQARDKHCIDTQLITDFCASFPALVDGAQSRVLECIAADCDVDCVNSVVGERPSGRLATPCVSPR